MVKKSNHGYFFWPPFPSQWTKEPMYRHIDWLTGRQVMAPFISPNMTSVFTLCDIGFYIFLPLFFHYVANSEISCLLVWESGKTYVTKRILTSFQKNHIMGGQQKKPWLLLFWPSSTNQWTKELMLWLTDWYKGRQLMASFILQIVTNVFTLCDIGSWKLW